MNAVICLWSVAILLGCFVELRWRDERRRLERAERTLAAVSLLRRPSHDAVVEGSAAGGEPEVPPAAREFDEWERELRVEGGAS